MYHSVIWLILLTSSLFWHPSVAAPFVWLLEDSRPDGLVLTLKLPPLKIETIQNVDSTCDAVSIPDWAKTVETGYPELPITGQLLQIPAEGQITAEIIEGQVETISHINPCLTPQLTLTTQGQTLSKPAHPVGLQTAYPPSVLKMSERMYWRGLSVARLTVTPVQWQTTTQTLHYYTQMRIRVQFEKTLPSPQKYRSRSVNHTYEEIQQQTLVNYVPVPVAEPPFLRKRVEPISTDEVDRKTQLGKALRFGISQAGIYRLTYEEMVKAGLPDLVHPKHLSLTNQGQAVAIKVIASEETIFTNGDAIEFYAEGIDTEFTGENVYWLQWQKKGVGNRIAYRDGQLTPAGQPQIAFYDRLHIEENRKLWEQVPQAPKEDYWFWQELTTSSKNSSGEYDIPILFPTPDPNAPEAILSVHFQGSTDTPHHTQIALNGNLLSDATWQGYEQYTQEMTVMPQQLSADGKNTLTIKLPSATEEVEKIYLNWVEIAYWRQLSAEQDKLSFVLQGTGQQQVTINAFSTPEITIYDITDPHQVIEIQNVTVEKTDKTYQATFEAETNGERTYYATTTTQFKQPTTVSLWQPSRLQSPKNGADYILITTDEFLPAVAPLVELRKQQGLRVKTVSVEEIYDEFNDGRVDPAAIKAFLTHAYTHWQTPAPTYVLLVGEASIDYRGYLRAKKQSRVPTHLLDLEGFQYIVPPSDNWFVSVEGEDTLPEMIIGRIPADSTDSVTVVVDKIVRFETGTHPSLPKILLVADANEMFQNLHEEIIIPHIPNLFAIDKVYLHDYFAEVKTKEDRTQKVLEARQAIVNNINAGAMITTYYGHGTSSNWSAGSGLFKSEHVAELTNAEQLTFLLTMSCINGHFTAPYKPALAEVFISSPTGIIAGLLPSNLSYPSEDVVLSDELFTLLFAQPGGALGAITTQAKIAAYQRGASRELVEIFTFFGDPVTALKPW